MKLRFAVYLAIGIVLSACGAAYRYPTLFHGRNISRKALPSEDYAIYSSALPEFLPDGGAPRNWIAVTGITIRPEDFDASVFAGPCHAVAAELMGRLRAAGDSVYVITNRFAESLAVAMAPMVDTTNWAPIQWERTVHRPYPAGLVSLSRPVMDESSEWAIVYGLWGHGPVGTGFPRVVLLQKESGGWTVAEAHSLGE